MALSVKSSTWLRLLAAFIFISLLLSTVAFFKYPKDGKLVTDEKIDLEITTVSNFELHIQDFPNEFNEMRFFPIVRAEYDGKKYTLARDSKLQTITLIEILSNPAMIPLPKEFTNSQPIHVSPTEKGYFVLSYNPLGKNVSGQSINAIVQWLDLWKFDLINKTYKKVARLEGGLTSEVKSLQTPNGNYFCLDSMCHMYADGKVVSIGLPNIQPVELGFEKGSNYVSLIGRSINDDRFVENASLYYKCDLQETVAKCKTIVEKGVPFFEKTDKDVNQVSIKFAKTSKERLRVILRDIDNQILPFLGTNNSEGRIAWQATYVIEGLDALSKFKDIEPNIVRKINSFKSTYLRWLASEVINNKAFISSKRYSFNRTSLFSKLHTARIANLLNLDSSNSQIIDVAKEQLVEVLKNENLTLEVVEKADTYFLRFKPGANFWADGVKVPWNYQSSIVEFAMIDKKNRCNFEMLGNHVLEDFLDDFSDAEFTRAKNTLMWNYSNGPLHYGWKKDSGVSSNTKSYSGDFHVATPEAHSSYRTMDARAFMVSARCSYSERKGWNSVFERAFEKGLLEPSFLAATAEDFTYRLNESQRNYWGRLTDIWQISNSAWTIVESRKEISFDLLG